MVSQGLAHRAASGSTRSVPDRIPNRIGGEERPAVRGGVLAKHRPTDGTVLTELARSGADDVAAAVEAARVAFGPWSRTPAVTRGEVLHRVASTLEDAIEELTAIVAAETGKSPAEARGETRGAIALGRFFAGEGQRLYGRTTGSGRPGRQVLTVREPIGVAGLIVAANTPIANVAWKVFPALVCGNTAVLKAAEDTPATAWAFARIALEAGLPPGVLNVIQGAGAEAGVPLVAHPDVGVISFTGSTRVGTEIQALAGRRLARVSLELGGKNALVILDDADLDRAVDWALLSAFSNAGQRCAAASRIVVERGVADEVRERLVARTRALRVGPTDADDLGPVINARALHRMEAALAAAGDAGAEVLVGGSRLEDDAHRNGYYLAPTILANVDPRGELARTELFGPITALLAARDLDHAIALTNDSPYGLTAAVHTRSYERAMAFARRVESGVVTVNGGTHGSEPHLPFGGVKQSGNGTREPGTEALDVYTSTKNVVLDVDPALLEPPRGS